VDRVLKYVTAEAFMKKIEFIAALAMCVAMWGCGHTNTQAISSDTELTPYSFGGSRIGSDKEPLDSTTVESTASLSTTSTYVATSSDTATTTAPVVTTETEVMTTPDSNPPMMSSSTATETATTPAPTQRHRRMKKN